MKKLIVLGLITSMVSGCLSTKPVTLAEKMSKETAKHHTPLVYPATSFAIQYAEGTVEKRKWDSSQGGALEGGTLSVLGNEGFLAASVLINLFGSNKIHPMMFPDTQLASVYDGNIKDAFNYGSKVLNDAMKETGVKCTVRRSGKGKTYDDAVKEVNYNKLFIGKKTGEYYGKLMTCIHPTDKNFDGIGLLAVPSKKEAGKSIITVIQNFRFENPESKELGKYYQFAGEKLFLDRVKGNWSMITPGFQELTPNGWKVKVSENGNVKYYDVPNHSSFDEEKQAEYYLNLYF